MRQGALFAQSFDPKRLQLAGEATLIAKHVGYDLHNGRGAFSASETGVLAYWSGRNRQLTWVDRAGKRLGPLGPPGACNSLQLSPDEKTVAVERSDPSLGAPIFGYLSFHAASRYG